MNYYRRYMGDYMRDTMHLSMIEHGAYSLLLDAYYATGKPLQPDYESLYRVCRAVSRPEQESARKVADQFFKIASDNLRHNERADLEIGIAQATIAKQRNGGASGATSKWGNGYSGPSTRRARERGARELGTHTEEQWQALFVFCGERCAKCGGVDRIVKDHIKPIYQGGSDAIDNIQPLCRPCNSSKGPDCTDYRVDGWLSHLMSTGLSTGLSTDRSLQPPTTNHQPTETKTKPLARRDNRASLGDGEVVEKIPAIGGDVEVKATFVAELERLYPAVDVPQTLREIRGWNLANEEKRKTQKGVPRHINRWMTRVQNGG